jgi:acetolactate synthase-1/2/3 large subunit
MRVVTAAEPRAACLMAAVVGSLGDAPGAAAVALGAGGVRAVDAVGWSAGGVRDALAQAMRDRSPAVVVGDAALDDVGALVKASIAVDAASAGHWGAHAVRLAMREPRGPVYLALGPAAASAPALPVLTSVLPDPLPVPEPGALDRAAQVLAAAVRPLLVAGIGCRVGGIAAWLRALAESLPAPVLVTAKGKGALPDPHPLHLGLVRPGPSSNPVLARADLIATIGVDASEAAPCPWPVGVPVLHLAASPWANGESAPTWEVVGDIALSIEELAPRLRGRQRADWDVAEVARLKAAAAGPPGEGATSSAASARALVAAVREATPPGTVAVVAVSDGAGDFAAAWSAVAPGELVVPAPPAAPGFALPAVLAALLARPAARAVCFASARQILEGAPEVDTAVNLGLAPLVVVVDDGAVPPVGPPIAALLGGAGWSASAGGVRAAVEQWLAGTRPVFVDARRAPHDPRNAAAGPTV